MDQLDRASMVESEPPKVSKTPTSRDGMQHFDSSGTARAWQRAEIIPVGIDPRPVHASTAFQTSINLVSVLSRARGCGTIMRGSNKH